MIGQRLARRVAPKQVPGCGEITLAERERPSALPRHGGTAPDLARGYQTDGTPRFNDRWRVEATLAAMTLRLVPRPNRQRPDTASAPVPRRRLTANKHPAHRVA